ncbi:uncharacterized protein LOC123311865 isoform X1 [Coccinella septempunctata]|uniref:uncharacterized protein LOC123311865 isoform X1 n=1 Tax=Coccinella septempunctata TaxID=41139 RepID=UPI001D0653C4|nr:uncharacterized protein LOC123311865 isoform X1 [Coccinella septempunctata]
MLYSKMQNINSYFFFVWLWSFILFDHTYCMNDDSNNNNNNNNNAGYCGELINEQETSEDKVIETVDLATNEIVNFKENILNYQGKTYLLRDISYKWKKDCRMWLWKNRPSTHKEIGDLCNNQNITITTLA